MTFEFCEEIFLDCAKLSAINRNTRLFTTGKNESTVDHTFFLTLVCRAFASKFLPDLNLEKVTLLALLHDYHETISGDLCSLIEDEDYLKQEELAKNNLIVKYKNILPEYSDLIEEMSQLQTEESKFVNGMDKVACVYADLFLDMETVNERNMVLDAFIENRLKAMGDCPKIVKDFLDYLINLAKPKIKN